MTRSMVVAITTMGTSVLPEMLVMVVPVSAMAVRMVVAFIGAVVVIVRHCPVGFVLCVTVGPIPVIGLSVRTHA